MRHVSRSIQNFGIWKYCLMLVASLPLLLSATVGQGQVSLAGTQVNVGGSSVGSPAGIAVDGGGNVYVADQQNNQVVAFKLTGSAYSAPSVFLGGLSKPAGIASDWSGNVYVADTGNNRIVMVAVSGHPAGGMQTVLSGLNAPSGVAVDTMGNVYVADTGNNRVLLVPWMGGAFGVPISIGSNLNGPMGVAVDASRNVLIADTGNNRIVKCVSSASGYVSQTLVAANLHTPQGISFDKSGNLYVADSGNSRMLEEPWQAAANRFNAAIVIGSDFTAPRAVAPDYSGNLFVADIGTNQVIEVTQKISNFSPLAMNVSSSSQTYNFAVAAGTTIGTVSVLTDGLVGKDFLDTGTSSCVAQTYAATTICGVNVIFTPSKPGTRRGAIALYDGSGNSLATAYMSGTGTGPEAVFTPGTVTTIGTGLSGPSGVYVDGNGNVFISDTGNNRVVEVPTTGSGYGQQLTIPLTGLNAPMGLTVDAAGNLFVTSNGNDKVIKLPWNANGYGTQSKAGTGMYGPSGVTVDGAGNVYIANTLNNQVNFVPWNGSSFTLERLVGLVKYPESVAVDPQGNAFIAMPYLKSVIEVPWDGSKYLMQIAVPILGLSFPAAIAVDANSNLYVLDSDTNSVIMLPWTGSGFAPQITVATGFNAPSALAVDTNGSIYVADTGNNQVVKIDRSSPPSLTFANTYLGSTSADSAQTINVGNIGNMPLTFSSVSYAADFPEDGGITNACMAGTSVAPGANCELSIDFTPQVSGSPLQEALNITDNTLNAEVQQSINVTGIGIGKQAQTVSFPALPSVTYGSGMLSLQASASSGLPVSYTIVSGPASLNSRGNGLTIQGAGMIVIQATQPGNSVYQSAASVVQTLVVSPAVLTVTPASVTATYGAIPTSFRYSISGFVPGDYPVNATTGTASVSSSATSSSAAGNYVLTAGPGTLSAANYAFVFAQGTLTVVKAVLQVRALAASMTYGSGLPSLTYQLSGFVNGDTASSVAGAPAMSTSATAKSAVGSYLVSPSLGTLASSNYTFLFSTNRLVVVPALLTVAANNQSMVYGSSVPQMSYTISGFVNGDSQAIATSGAPIVRLAAQVTSVGSYTITVGVGTLASSNYGFKVVYGVFTVTKATLVVTPNAISISYGQKLPQFGYVITGFTGTDTQNNATYGVAQVTSSASPFSKPGTYVIQAAQGTLAANNYNFVFATSVLTIGKATLTIVPRAVALVYGNPIPALAYDLQGFVNGDTVSSVSGSASLQSAASANSGAGTYSITATVGTLASSSYTFSSSSGTLTISKATLTLVPRSVAMTYGSSLPALAYDWRGFAGSDTASVVKGSPVLTTLASSSARTGSYLIHASVGSLVAANYTFNFVTGAVVVKPAALSVVPASAVMTYGGKIPPFSYTVAGFVNGDTVRVISGSPVITTKAVSGASVGSYPINVAVGTLSAVNYTFQPGSAVLTVNQAVLTVQANAVAMVYGSKLPGLSYTISGLVNSDTVHVLSGVPVLLTVASSTASAGTYPVTVGQGSLKALNYGFAFANGSLTISKAVLTVTAKNQAMTYGGTLPGFTYVMSGFVVGDTQASACVGAPLLTSGVTVKSGVGSYPVTIAVGSLVAKNYSFQFVPGSVVVTRAPLTVTADNLSMKQGAPVPTLTDTVKGFVNGDTAAGAIQGAATLATTATSTAKAGTYAIAITMGTMQSTNYVLTLVNGTLTVTQ